MDLKEFAKKLSSFEEVAGIIRFGSKHESELSDIDIAVVLSSKPSKDLLSFLAEAPEKFDISFFNRLPSYVQFQVIKKGEIIAVFDKEAFDEELLRAMRRYWELRPFYREVWNWKPRGLKQRLLYWKRR